MSLNINQSINVPLLVLFYIIVRTVIDIVCADLVTKSRTGQGDLRSNLMVLTHWMDEKLNSNEDEGKCAKKNYLLIYFHVKLLVSGSPFTVPSAVMPCVSQFIVCT